MTTPLGSLAAGVLFLLAAPAAMFAAETSHPCADQLGDVQRLACYDAAYGKPRAAAATTTVSPALPAAAAPAAAASVSRPAPPPAAPAKAEEEARPGPVESQVTALRRMLDGRHQATLANGDTWVQAEPDPRAQMRVGDTVTIRPAALGSFMLVTASGLSTRVRRVK